jgi:hypothetical protein
VSFRAKYAAALVFSCGSCGQCWWRRVAGGDVVPVVRMAESSRCRQGSARAAGKQIRARHSTPGDGDMGMARNRGMGKARQTCSVASCHTAVEGPKMVPDEAQADRPETRHHSSQREGPPALFPRQAPNGPRWGKVQRKDRSRTCWRAATGSPGNRPPRAGPGWRRDAEWC